MRSSKAVAAEEDALNRAAVAAPNQQATGRRKATGNIRAWLVVSDSGRSYLEEVGKHSIMKRTGLPARDLRVLDPQLSYPSTILGRERAIVINLEHIKAVITATEVLVPNSRDPLVAPFVQDLQARVSSSSYGAPQRVLFCYMKVAEFDGVDTDVTAKDVSTSKTQLDSPRLALDAYDNGTTKVLPFEFRALEACLESACRLLESETLTLEQEAYPALDELTSKISTLNLERVRQIKSRLVAISGRVQKVRDELEHLLDDDMDMAEMYLSEKLAFQRVGETSLRVDIGNVELEMDDDRDEDAKSETESNTGGLGGFKLNIEELEMLLEAYFVQIDGTLNKLSTLREYVDDTEDYINIMLDEKQNQLLQMGVMLSTATLVVTAGVVVVGIFGMNITIDLFNMPTYHQFWETTGGTVGGCIILYVLAICWGKKSGLLQ
ncbi:magnesium transporter MRS2-F-like isoform X1 [Dendrobium catenatum]|uniref:magnesium transporter MRS2-F-like isoform X1 n=1 Tax=Dendrobium catenatum TaxID=906689 RepID=UPI0009F715CB|nr:magnesium transporter MRS2-F-like isoform X1 [Dendrobium catenatum]